MMLTRDTSSLGGGGTTASSRKVILYRKTMRQPKIKLGSNITYDYGSFPIHHWHAHDKTKQTYKCLNVD
jgi:hypothetical protein